MPNSGLRHILGDHNPTYISMCCVIYDLEGSNDAYLLDANLTSDDAKKFPGGIISMRKYFYEEIFLDSFFLPIKPPHTLRLFTPNKHVS
jgi:hypothetical protein